MQSGSSRASWGAIGPLRSGAVLRAILVALLASLLAFLAGGPARDVRVSIDLRSTAGVEGQLFYAGPGEEYHPGRSIEFHIENDGRWRRYHFDFPVHGSLERVRLDPGASAGVAEVGRIQVEAAGQRIVLAAPQLAETVVVANDLDSRPIGSVGLRLLLHAPDPYIGFRIPQAGQAQPWQARAPRLLIAAIVALVAWLAIELVIGRAAGRFARAARMPSFLHTWAAKASDPGVLDVPASAIAVAGAVVCAGILYVALHLHQSSIGMWEEMYPARPVAQRIDLGSPRAIRSDEWNTQTPWALGQVATGMPQRNVNVGGAKAPLLASVPVEHPSAVAQFKFLGFRLLGTEAGFSWWWAYKTLGLFLAFFWLLLIMTRGDVLASALGGAWIGASSFTQWWLSSNLPEIMLAFAVATIGGCYLLFAQRRLLMGIGGALIAYALLSLMLHVYPPFIVPLAYLGAAILLGFLLEPGRFASARNGIGWRLLFLGVAVLVVAVVGGKFLMDAMPSIRLMVDTDYPGRRLVEGGHLPLHRVFYGFFEAFRVGELSVPLPPGNASEASSFVLLVPLLLVAMPLHALARRRNGLLVALLAYCTLAVSWMSMPLPGALRTLLRNAGWEWSQPERSLLGLGVASILAVVVLFSRIRRDSVDSRPESARWMAVAAMALCLMLYGWKLQGVDPEFFTWRRILLASFAVTMLGAGVLMGRAVFFSIGLAVVAAPALTVNPLVSGLSAITQKPVLLAAAAHGGSPGDRWVVAGEFVFSQGLKAHGLEVLTGSHMIPDMQLAEVLDPGQLYRPVWNRYAHVVMRTEPGRRDAAYVLVAPDLYEVALDICGRQLQDLAVTHVAYTSPVPDEDLRCLRELPAPPDSGVRLFALERGTDARTTGGELPGGGDGLEQR